MVKENSYINIQAFMVNDLHLKGNELIVYAIIFGFSQDGESEFTGSLQYLADWTCSTKQGVMKALQSLCEKQLILKNVEYKNNIRFCTYKSTVLNKVEQGIKQSLMGYETEFNGGIKQSLPNNINNTLDNKLEHTQEDCVPVPDYIKQKEIKKEDVNIVAEMFEMLQAFNSTNPKHKIPISKSLFQFQCKEGRAILSELNNYSREELSKALCNYLTVADSETWKTSFSFGAFCNSIAEYTTEFFDPAKYINIPKSEEELKTMTEPFADLHATDKWFDYAVFHHHRAEWIKAGKPEGESFVKWADKVYEEDRQNGKLDSEGCYI